MRNLIFITTLFLVIHCSKNNEIYQSDLHHVKIVDYPTFSKIDSVVVKEKDITCSIVSNCYKGGIFFDHKTIGMIKSEKIKKNIYFNYLNKGSADNILEKDYTAFDFIINNKKYPLNVIDEESIKKYCSLSKFPLSVKCKVYWFTIYSGKNFQNYIIVDKIN